MGSGGGIRLVACQATNRTETKGHSVILCDGIWNVSYGNLAKGATCNTSGGISTVETRNLYERGNTFFFFQFLPLGVVTANYLSLSNLICMKEKTNPEGNALTYSATYQLWGFCWDPGCTIASPLDCYWAQTSSNNHEKGLSEWLWTGNQQVFSMFC